MKESLLQRFKWYWSIRNSKFKKQLRPTIKFLAKHLRKLYKRGELTERIVNDSKDK